MSISKINGCPKDLRSSKKPCIDSKEVHLFILRWMVGFLISDPADPPELDLSQTTKLTIYTNVDRATRKLYRSTDVRTYSLYLMAV